MLRIDILTSFVVSGAASLVAALMTQLARPDDRHTRDGLSLCSLAFLVLGLGMFQLVLGVDDAHDLTIEVALVVSSLSVGLFTWGLARLGNERISRPLALGGLAAAVAAMLLACGMGGWALSYTFVAVNAVLALLAVWVQRKLILQPSNPPERVLGLAVVAFAISWLVRALLTIQYQGPQLLHHLLVPVVTMPLFATYYGVMPIFMATIVLSVINARLARRLEVRALTDELTGLMSRRALRELAPATIERARAGGERVAVMMVDIDHFKEVNDRHGHLVGDDVLRQTAEIVRSSLRPDALVTRYGGEEFAALVPLANPAVAHPVAERLRAAIAQQPFRSADLPLPLTVSIGLALLGEDEALDAALQRSDKALYRAKRGGRDRVEADLDQLPSQCASLPHC